MRPVLVPQTALGKRCLWLVLLAIAYGVATNLIATAQGNTIEYPNPINSPLLGTVLYLTFLSLFIAAITGISAVRRQGERSLLVYLVILIGISFSIGALMMIVGAALGIGA